MEFVWPSYAIARKVFFNIDVEKRHNILNVLLSWIDVNEKNIDIILNEAMNKRYSSQLYEG